MAQQGHVAAAIVGRTLARCVYPLYRHVPHEAKELRDMGLEERLSDRHTR